MALGLEALWVGPLSRIAMEWSTDKAQRRPFGNEVASEFDVLKRLAADKRNGG